MRNRSFLVLSLFIIGLVLLSSCRQAQSNLASLPTSEPLPVSEQAELANGTHLSYTVTNASGSQVAQFKSEVVSSEPLEEYQTWKVVTNIQVAAGPAQQITSTAWVDQESGVVLRSEYKVVYEQPQANTFDGKQVKIKEFHNSRTFELSGNTMDETQLVVDADGEKYQVTNSGPADFSIFRLTRPVQAGDYYPWQTSAYPHQVEGEQQISTPAGEFKASVIKRFVVPDQQYYLEFFDQASGLLVKSENWARQGDEWKKIEETVLTGLQSGE